MKQYIVDAFTDSVFHGNQAAVCVLDEWLPKDLMMDITRRTTSPRPPLRSKRERNISRLRVNSFWL